MNMELIPVYINHDTTSISNTLSSEEYLMVAKTNLIRAADMGNVKAQHKLAMWYDNDNELENAFKYFKMAADHGNRIDQCNTGICYLEGSGVEKNIDMSHHYLRLAEKQGNKQAREYLNRLEFFSYRFSDFWEDITN